MKSSSGAHYPALDHIRCLAIFLVFTWHFLHGQNGTPVPLEFVPAVPPFSLLDEGHTGVSLFMALSGYLFAKLLDGRSVRYLPFLANRALRLLPLLVAVTLLEGARRYLIGESLSDYVIDIVKAPLLPTLPNGGWSITVEAHFYVLLPLILMACRRSALAPLLLIAIAILVRVALYTHVDHIRSLTYFYLTGHIDQFLAGIFAFHFRAYAKNRHWDMLAVFVAFSVFFWWFDAAGGFFRVGGDPSSHWIWIILPTIEAAAYSFGIAYYDTSFSSSKRSNIILSIIERGGAYSYSIYLLHIFFVFGMSDFIYRHVMTTTNFYFACFWSAICFLMMIPIGYLSYTCIESPFLRLRVRYIKDASADGHLIAPTTRPIVPAA